MDFLMDIYLPAITEELANNPIHIDLFDWIKFILLFTGAILKIIWAFFYMEGSTLSADIFASETSIWFGGSMLPAINLISNFIS